MSEGSTEFEPLCCLPRQNPERMCERMGDAARMLHNMRSHGPAINECGAALRRSRCCDSGLARCFAALTT